MHTLTDVLIAGGGLAGSAAAIQLARIGFSVELFERASFPREKPCGEGLMPAGVAALERIGLNASAGAPFRGIRLALSRACRRRPFPRCERSSLPGARTAAPRFGLRVVRVGGRDPQRNGAHPDAR